MPLYTYQCPACDATFDELRRIKHRNRAASCVNCGYRADRVIAPVSVNAWQPEWKFPNLSETGDGSRSFKTERSYKAYLEENGFRELSLGIREI